VWHVAALKMKGGTGMKTWAVMGCAAVALSVLGTGCVMPMRGSVMAPITLDHVVSDPGVDNAVRPTKHGEAKASAILFFGTGDASIQTAMKAGGITKVHHVDYNVKNILFIYSEVITTVYGE
jgi:hypothetical protein